MHTNEMNSIINKLREKYRVEIDSPFRIEIDGKEIQFDCLIKGYGAPEGMVIDSKWNKIEPVADTLVELGYGFSCFKIDDSAIENFSEVLTDWGKVSA